MTERKRKEMINKKITIFFILFTVILASAEGQKLVLDIKSEKQFKKLTHYKSPAEEGFALDWMPDGKAIIYGRERQIRKYELETGNDMAISIYPGKNLWELRVSPTGKKMIKVKDSEIEKGQITLIFEEKLPLTVIDDFVVRSIKKKGLSTPMSLTSSLYSGTNPENELNLYEPTNPDFEPSLNPMNSSTSGELVIPLGELDWRDYSVGSKFPAYEERERICKREGERWVSTDEFSKVIFGMVLRYNPEDGSGYYLWVDGKEKLAKGKVFPCKVILEKRVKGERKTILEKEYISKKSLIKIEARIEGERIEVKIEDEPFAEVTDRDIEKGMVALVARPATLFLPWDLLETWVEIKRLIKEEEKGKTEKEPEGGEWNLNL